MKYEWRDVCILTTKDLQLVLKKAVNKTETLDFEHRLGINNYDSSQIVLFRRQCKNVKLRHIYYRLISRDLCTKERMLRFCMSLDNLCTRCGSIETYRHLLYNNNNKC